MKGLASKGTVEWHACSTDFGPIDFSACKIIKDRVYLEKIQDLKEHIIHEFGKWSSLNIIDTMCFFT